MNGVNKFVWYGETKFDISTDTVTPSDVKSGVVFHDRDGMEQTGSNTNDADTSDGNVLAGDMLAGVVGYSRGQRIVGTMPQNGDVSLYITDVDSPVTIPFGNHTGAGTVGISPADAAKLANSDNIAEGVTILGKTGTHKAGADEVKQDKTVTPGKTQQLVTPDPGYTCLSQVTVNGIPYREEPNGGGTAVYIG